MEFNNSGNLTILFVLNPRSGNTGVDYQTLIEGWFKSNEHRISFFEMPPNCLPEQVRQEVEKTEANRVVAIGGDGTIKLVAEAIMQTGIPLCIIPAGSANGLAKELLIPTELEGALGVVTGGQTKIIHMVRINGHLCIHLSDIGLNALMVKRFEKMAHRGMWAYLKAAWQVFWSRYRISIEMTVNGEKTRLRTFMLVLANGTRYGTGAVINPVGSLGDGLFEVVLVRKIAIRELFKMWVTHQPYHPEMTNVIQTTSVQVRCRKPVHFQVDGEYLGKVNHLDAELVPDALVVMVP